MSSKFSLSNKKLLSCDLGELVPIGMFETLPGDVIQQATSALIRCSPLLAPVMHPVNVRIHHYFVPYRLIWEDFEDFITGGPDGNDATVYPTINIPGGGTPVGSLSDYLGVPPTVALAVSALPYRAYSLIWNEFYRDQDLQTELTVSTASGVDSTSNATLQHVNWEKDYFTSSRPWEQKGDAITLPLGTSAPVKGIGFNGTIQTVDSNQANIRETGGGSVTYPFSVTGPNNADGLHIKGTTNAGATTFPDITADLSNATAVTINTLREALALQRFAEARARFGSRYTEYCRYLGVAPEDSRLQRPEYLGGGSNTIQFSEVLQTAEGTNPVGELRGHGIGAMRSNRYRRYIPEHGLIMSLLSIRPKTIYMQGLSRMWNRRAREDFWQKELQHIGQQEILNKEIYAAHGTPDGVFGYQDRYDEYRRQESSVAGEFRTTALNHWHMAREFSSAPALNSDFVKCVPTERTFAVPSEDVMYVMANHSIQARRLVAASGTSFTL